MTVDARAAMMSYSKLQVPADSTKRYCQLMRFAEDENFLKEQQAGATSSTSTSQAIIEPIVNVSFLPPVGARSSTTSTKLSEDMNHSMLSGARTQQDEVGTKAGKRAPAKCTVCYLNGETRNDHRAHSTNCPYSNKRQLSLSQPVVSNKKHKQ